MLTKDPHEEASPLLLAVSRLETPVAVLDGDLTVIAHNDAFAGLTGFSEPTASVLDLIPELRLSRAQRKLARRARTSVLSTGSGSRGEVSIEYVLRPVEDARWLLEGHDRSRMQEAQALLAAYTREMELHNKRLAQSEHAIANLIHSLRQAVFAVNRSGMVTSPVSSYARQVFGIDITGRSVAELLIPDHPLDTPPWSVVDANVSAWDTVTMLPPRVEYTSPNGAHQHLQVTVTPILHAGTQVVRSIMFVVEDVSELVRLEEENALQVAEIMRQHADMRLVLDNVEQGLLSVDVQGRLTSQRSATIDRWFGPFDDGVPLWDMLGRADADFAALFELCWAQVSDGWLSVEVALSQLPTSLSFDGQLLELSFFPVLEDGRPQQVVVVMTDRTAQVVQERTERSQLEMLSVLEHALHDRLHFARFVDATDNLFEELAQYALDESVAMHLLHTLKGNLGLWRVRSLSVACHELEDCILARGLSCLSDGLPPILDSWAELRSKLWFLLESESDDTLFFASSDYVRCLEMAYRQTGDSELTKALLSWSAEPTARSLARLADQADELAARLGVDLAPATIEDHGLRWPHDGFDGVWDVMGHVIRNALDHGLSTLLSRRPTLRLATRHEGDAVVIEVEDNGEGIDWERVRSKAVAHGVPWETHDDLVQALFEDALSTKDEVSMLSGRGVGLAAVRREVRKRGGSVHVTSTPGQGTCIALRLPRQLAELDIHEVLARA